MDKFYWQRIKDLLNEDRLAKLDKLDEAIEDPKSSDEYVMTALKEYGRSLMTLNAFSDHEDEWYANLNK